jgi:hypothetical protein
MPVYAGQWYQSASLTVFGAGEYLIVQWIAQPGWSSKVFHIYAGTSAPGSAPGSYPFVYTLPTPVTSASFKIKLRDVFPTATCDSSFFFAFHTETINDGTAACVSGKGCPGTTETSWWGASNKFKTGWGSFGSIQLCCCYKSKTDSVFSVSATLTKKIKSVGPETDVLTRASQQALTENQIQQAFAKLLAGVIPADDIYVLELTQLNNKGDVSVVLGFADTDSVTAFTATRILMNLSDADYAAVGLENVRVSDLPEDQRSVYNQQVKVLAQAADYSSNSPSSGASSLQICWMAMMLLLVNLWM